MTENAFDQLDGNDRQAPREVLRTDTEKKHEVVMSVCRALSRSGPHRRAFQYSGKAVVIIEDKSAILRKIGTTNSVTRSVPRQANLGLLQGPIEGVVDWIKFFRTPAAEAGDRPVSMPDWCPKMICDTYGQGLPPLSGIADFPVISTSGKLLSGMLGYDPETRLYVQCQPVAHDHHHFSSPSEALDYLVDDWLGEFNFATRADAIRSLTIPLTILNRRTRIHGGCPIPFVTAPTPETGKTVLVQVLSEAVTGQQLAASSWDHDSAEERRKMLISVAIENPAAVLFDNIQNGWEVRCSTLERYATSDMIADRMLHKNETATVPTTAMLIFTGNNIGAGSPDLVTRSYEIRLERPKVAKKFKRSDIIKWTAKNRAKIFAALMCIAQSKPTPAWTPVSRFPSWAEHVGSKLQFASGQKDLFPAWDGEQGQAVSDEFLELVKAMRIHPYNEDGWQDGEISKHLSEKIAALEPHRTREWMKSGSMRIDGAVIPARSIKSILRKYDGHLADGLRLRLIEVKKGHHPRRLDRKLFVFKVME